MKRYPLDFILPLIALLIFSFTLTYAERKNCSTVQPSSVEDTLYFFKGDKINNLYLVTKNANVNTEDVYSIENGTLHYNSPEQSYLRTEDEFENYTFHCEWRWKTEDEKGNSGILIHLQKPDSVWPKCMQIQLKKDNAGDLIAMSGVESDQTTGKVKETGAKLSPSNENPGIEWNSCDIICRNDSVTVYINGLLQNTGTNMNVKKGAVALQLESRPIIFRNTYLIKE